ncbi:MAG TPA: nicotinate-nucleotide adenylyltransferase [Stellaceae bacterium]|nr:nicotinate-nucleotide adenylyltransferase [Stellaceae bacterium]
MAVGRRRIGVLGGSFNPAHGGHMHISREALRRLDLDEVWWLVSPQNPLKPETGMAPFAVRLAEAAAIAAADRRVRVSDIEARLGTRYTADTLQALRRRFPGARFVWLMGGDNLAQFPYWRRWQEIFRSVPIAVFDRPGSASRALAGVAAQRFARARVPLRAARRLASLAPPAWAFFHTRLDPRSATRIRALRSRQPPRENKPHVTSLDATMVKARAPRRRQRIPAADLLRQIIDTLEDGKAEAVVTIELAGKTTIADYMVVASGRSARQVAALTDHLEQILPRRVAVEGKSQGDWVLIDAGDVIVHLFRPEIRTYYNLEKMWGEALPDAESEPQAALQ